MSARRRHRLPKVRTPETPMLEQLGLAIGRICMASPPTGDAIMRGYTRALHEKVAGRLHTARDIADALRETERMYRELHPGARRKGRV